MPSVFLGFVEHLEWDCGRFFAVSFLKIISFKFVALFFQTWSEIIQTEHAILVCDKRIYLSNCVGFQEHHKIPLCTCVQVARENHVRGVLY